MGLPAPAQTSESTSDVEEAIFIAFLAYCLLVTIVLDAVG